MKEITNHSGHTCTTESDHNECSIQRHVLQSPDGQLHVTWS